MHTAHSFVTLVALIFLPILFGCTKVEDDKRMWGGLDFGGPAGSVLTDL